MEISIALQALNFLKNIKSKFWQNFFISPPKFFSRTTKCH